MFQVLSLKMLSLKKQNKMNLPSKSRPQTMKRILYKSHLFKIRLCINGLQRIGPIQFVLFNFTFSLLCGDIEAILRMLGKAFEFSKIVTKSHDTDFKY